MKYSIAIGPPPVHEPGLAVSRRMQDGNPNQRAAPDGGAESAGPRCRRQQQRRGREAGGRGGREVSPACLPGRVYVCVCLQLIRCLFQGGKQLVKTQHSPGLLPRSKELHVNKGLFAAPPPGRLDAGARRAQAPWDRLQHGSADLTPGPGVPGRQLAVGGHGVNGVNSGPATCATMGDEVHQLTGWQA